MTADNVLSICDNLNQLELDYNNWNMLTDDQKRISNDICMQRYGMNNIQLYEEQKARLTALTEAVRMIANNDTMKSLEDKMEQTRIAMDNDPMVVIIPVVDVEPFSVDLMYHNYMQLPQNYKNISNGISLSIWGCTVDEAYKKVKDLTTSNDSKENLNTVPKEEHDNFVENAFEKINNILNGKKDDIELKVERYDFTNDIPQVVPFFTYTEYCRFNFDKITVSDYINIDNPQKYYNLIESLQIQLESTKDKKKKKELESNILKLGWFPYKRINAKSMKDARERQAEWFNKNMQTNIIDLTDYEVATPETVPTALTTEQLLEGVGIDGDKSRLEPLFLTFTSSNNVIGKIIKKWTKSYWSHAGISLNSRLDKIYTFSAKELNENSKQGGFRLESLELYSSLNINDLLVLCFFIDKDIKKKIKEELAFYEKNQANTKYDKGNYFNIAFNIKKDDDSMQMVCSQFVDYILKLAGIDITNKASNLVTPADLSKADSNDAINIYALFEGKIPNYKFKDIDKKVKFIVGALDYEKLSAMTTENMKSNMTNTKVMESFLEVCTDNEEISSIQRQLRAYINPDINLTPLVNESTIIELCKENHKNLMNSTHSDIDRIKELLYENRGLSYYITYHEFNNNFAESYYNLEDDFQLHKGILESSGTIPKNLTGFAKYYEDIISNFGLKYN